MKALIIGGLMACSQFMVVAHAQADGGLQQERPDPEVLQGERFYQSGVQALRLKQFPSAIAYFERSLATKRNTADVFFNLVQATRQTEQWDKLVVYAQGFLFREQGTKDVAAVSKLLGQTFELLEGFGRRPVVYRFDVTPAGSEVRINGVPVANDGREVRLMPGKYAVSAEPEDFVGWREELVVKAGSAGETVKRELAAKVFRGKVRVVTSPAEGVRVFVDGEQIGVTPLATEVELDTGRRYLFRFERDGFDEWVRYVTPTKGDVIELKPRMEKVLSRRDVGRR